MTEAPRLEPYLDALRQDLPSLSDDARIRSRLTRAGLGVTVALASKTTAAAGSISLVKASALSTLFRRLAALPLLTQMGLFAAGTATVAAGPVWVALLHPRQVPAISRSQGDASATEAREPSAPPQPVPVDNSALAQKNRILPKEPVVGAGVRAVAAPKRPAQIEPTQPEPTALPQAFGDGSKLAEETRLIDAALGAMREGNLSLTGRLLDEHEERFPVARLARERQRVRHKLDEAKRHAVR